MRGHTYEEERLHSVPVNLDKYLTMGAMSYVAAGCEVLHERDGGRVWIGRCTSIGRNLRIFCGGYHHTDWVTTSPLREDRKSTYSKGDVEIGSDVWIGDDVTIMSGVKIHDGATVGACSVVASDVAPFTIVVGNPARAILDPAFDDLSTVRLKCGTPERRDALLKIAWWNWPEAVVRAHQDELCCPDIDAFIAKYLGKPEPTE